MLQVLRDSMKYLAWILWVVIGVFVLFVFVDFGAGVPGGGAAPARAAVTVGDREISYRDLERAHRALENQMRQQLGAQFSPELAEQLRLPMQALNRLVNTEILLDEADRMGLVVTDEELRRALLDSPMFKDGNGRFVGEEAYERAVRREGYTVDAFEAEIRDQLLLQRLVGAFEKSVAVADAEVEQRYREQVERAQLRYVAFPFTDLAGQVQVSDAEVETYFAAHREEYELPETRVAEYALVDPRVLQETLEVPDADLRAFYEEHREEYLESEQVRARHILVATPEEAAAAQARLAAGEDFAALAAEVSTAPEGQARGGDLGWFGKGRMVPPFEEAAFAAEVGKVVGPVQTDFGYHLIEVLEKRPAGQRSFDEVREAVRLRVAAERAATTAEEKARSIAAELREAGGNAPQKMAELSGQPGVELGSTEPFQRQGAVAPLGAAPALNAAAFELEQGGVTEPIRTPRGWVVMRVSELRPPRVPELGEVREQVRVAAERAKLEEMAKARLQQARTRLDAGATLDEVAAELGRPVQETQEFGSGSLVPGIGPAPDLAREALAKEEGAIGGPTIAAGRAILYQVSKKTRMDPATFATEKAALRDQLVQERVNTLLGALVNARKQELGVTYDPPLLQTLGITGPEAG